MQTAASAEGHQRKLARIVTAFDRDHANGPLHIGVGDAQNARRGGDAIHFQTASNEPTAAAARSASTRIPPPSMRLNAPQHHVRIGDRRFRPGAVTGRSRIGAGALRTHAQQPARIHARDGTAARAHGVNVEHRHANRKAVDRSTSVVSRAAPSARLTSVDVPPMSKPRIFRNPLRRAVSIAPTTPPAGPDSTVRTA